MFDESLDTPLKNRSNSLKARGSEREQFMFDDEEVIASSYGLKTISTFNMH